MARSAVSFRTLVLALVLGCAVLPLSAVGVWLAQSAVRSGETLLNTELKLMLDRITEGMSKRWETRRGILLLLARNVEVGNALAHDASPVRDDSVAAYLAEVYSPVRQHFPLVVIRDEQGRVRWRMEDTGRVVRTADSDRGVAFDADPPLVVRETIVEGGKRVGEMEAHVRFVTLVPIVDAARQVAGFTISIIAHDGALLYSASDADEPGEAHMLSLRTESDRPPVTIAVSAPLAPYVQPFLQNSRTGTIALVVVALVSLVLTTILARRLTRPLSALAGAADSVARGGLDQRVDLHGPDEVRRVAAAFNGMTENLRATLDSMARQRSLAAVGEFAASLAHEVRNALTAVRMDVQRARKKTEDSNVAELLERTLSHVQHLDHVVTGALHVARSGRAPSSVTDLSNVLSAAESSVANDLARAQVVLLRPDHNRNCSVEGDAAALQQLFTNLILNAAEASKPGSIIEISTSVANENVIVEVKDHGSGIASDHLEKVWEPLFTTKPSGTGLGLSIARQIATVHGGELDVASEEGQGTTVRLRLPARQAPASPSPLNPATTSSPVES